MNEIERIEATIGALQAQRDVIGDAVSETAMAPLRARLAALRGAADDGAALQSLRQATILFLDVVGSTALSSDLDPEDIQGVVDGALAALTEVVAAHRGRVLQYAGDSLLAVFGATEASEDDPERSVRCGLALLTAAERLARTVRERHAIDGFSVRVGIHTGRVLLGGGVDGEHTVRGNAVNIAARMEQTAPAGRLRISHVTYSHVRGVFDVVEEAVAVKGVEQPLRSYLVLRAKARAFRVPTRGVEGVETRMVGRDAELAQLQRAFEALHAGSPRAAILVVAEAGLGKSRLLYEFGNWAETRPEPFFIFQGRALPQTRGQPYGLLRDVLAWRLQISDSDPAAVARDKLVGGVAPLFDRDGESHAHLLGHLIGLDFSSSPHVAGIATDAAQIRARGFHAAVELLRRTAVSGDAPVLMLLDALHWADDASLDFIDHLLREARELPLLLIGLARPGVPERRPQMSEVPWHQMALSPLSRGDSRELADVLLQWIDATPPLLRELITGGADGNPFYMEELLKMLIDDGAIVTGGERWRVVPERLLATRVPTTLTGVLQARLDALAERDRQVLQQAAVLGVVFWDHALAALSGRAALDVAALASLARRELILAHEASAFGGAREYAFRHQLLQQVAYDGVLKRQRRAWHGRAADWIASQSGDRAGEYLGFAADHYERAGDAANASRHFARAADWAAVRGAYVQMLDYVKRGLALAAAADLDTRWKLIARRERFHVTSDDRAAHAADLDALQAIAEAQDDDALRADALWRRAYALDDAGDFEAAVEASRRCLALALKAGEEKVATNAYAGVGYELLRLGDFAAAQQAVDDGLAFARACGDRAIMPHLLTNAGGIASAQGDHAAALAFYGEALEATRELGNRTNEAVMLNNLGDGELRVGDHEAARQHLLAGLEIARATGNRAVEALALQNLAALAHQQGDNAAALEWVNDALAVQRTMGQRHSEGISLNIAGHAELALGRMDAAREAYRTARTLFAAIGDVALEMESVAGLARAALVCGDADKALADVRLLLAHRDRGGSFEGAEEPLRIALTCWQVLVAADEACAASVLDAAHAELQAQAARISDPRLRESLLRGVPHHRRIVEGWQRARR